LPSKKRAAKPKTKKGAKKARITSDDEEIEVPIPLTLQPEVVEIKLEAPKKGAKAVKEPKPKKVVPIYRDNRWLSVSAASGRVQLTHSARDVMLMAGLDRFMRWRLPRRKTGVSSRVSVS